VVLLRVNAILWCQSSPILFEGKDMDFPLHHTLGSSRLAGLSHGQVFPPAIAVKEGNAEGWARVRRGHGRGPVKDLREEEGPGAGKRIMRYLGAFDYIPAARKFFDLTLPGFEAVPIHNTTHFQIACRQRRWKPLTRKMGSSPSGQPWSRQRPRSHSQGRSTSQLRPSKILKARRRVRFLATKMLQGVLDPSAEGTKERETAGASSIERSECGYWFPYRLLLWPRAWRSQVPTPRWD
jgi:hypothetical protein